MYTLAMKRWLSITVFSLLFIFFVYPSAFIYPADTLPDNNDTRLIAYIIGQVQKNILEHKPLYFGTFFAPEQNTLTFSDLFLTSSVMTLPFRLLTNHPITVFNLVLVINFTLTILSSYLLFSYLFKDHWITILATGLFSFSGYHLSHLPHQQIFSLWLVFLSIYFFLRFQDSNKNIFLTIFILFSTAQLAESIFSFYLIFFIVLILHFCNQQVIPAKAGIHQIGINLNRFPIKSGMTRKIILQLIFALPLWLTLLFPYLQLHLKYPEATRPIRDAAHFSLGLEEIFTKYQSWTVIILFLASILAKAIISFGESSQSRNAWSRVWRDFGARIQIIRVRRKRGIIGRHQRDIDESQFEWMRKTFKIILLFSLIMPLGPVLKIFGTNLRIFGFPIPLPYSLFYYLFPGFTGFRTPSRFIVLALLSGVILIGYNLKPIFQKLTSRTKFVFILLIFSLLMLEADLPLTGYPVNINMHPLYQEVKNLPTDAVIIELPIKLWNMPDHEIESIRSLYTLSHNHRRFGGFSGFATDSWIDLTNKINANGLDQENLSKLKTLGVTHIIEDNQLTPLEF